MKFRKKPVVVEATQWFKHGDHREVRFPDRTVICLPNQGWIATLEGGHVVTPGDWIITGVKGEHYPCKPDIFAATYEPADSLASSPSQPATEVLDALRDVLAMIDEGYLVRNTSDDGEPGFAMRQLPYVMRLQKAARAAAPALVEGKK